MSIRKTIGKIHLVLGLVSGLVVFVVSVTGCLYAFQKELQDLSQPYRFVAPMDKAYLPPSVLMAQAEEELPGREALRVYYEGKDRAAAVLFYEKDFYHFTFHDPYTGETLKVKNMRTDFFTIVLQLHRTLLLPYGKHIVGYSTLIFLIMLVSGIVLWWPRNRAGLKQRFTIKWQARWRRKNYDLHNVLGFYMTWIALFITLSGLIFAFGWARQAVYWLGGDEMTERKRPISTLPETELADALSESPVDAAWYHASTGLPENYSTMVMLPADEEGAIAITTYPLDGTFYRLQYHYYDQFSGEPLKGEDYFRQKPFEEAGTGEKIIRMNYDIHTGGILGLAGKCLAFFASLVAASLPVTGFLIWWGRRKKKKKPVKKRGVASANSRPRPARLKDRGRVKEPLA